MTTQIRAARPHFPVCVQGVVSGDTLPCREQDPELWFAESPERLEVAKAYCRTCPLRSACLAGALARAEPWGVWGGEIVKDGAVLPHKRPRGRPRTNRARRVRREADRMNADGSAEIPPSAPATTTHVISALLVSSTITASGNNRADVAEHREVAVLQERFSPWGGLPEPADSDVLHRSFKLSLDPSLRSPKRAREALREACREWAVGEPLTDAAALVATELVTNSVLHAKTPLLLMAEYEVGHLVVAVSDGDPTVPQPQSFDPTREHGRGLAIAASLGVTWGMQMTVIGKVVWVALHAGDEAAADPTGATGRAAPG